MRTIVFVLLFFTILLSLIVTSVHAVYEPSSVPNNKFGIHILHPDELDRAAKLVNSSGGDWGYVVMPVRTDELVLSDWQEFMDKANNLHLIPILRLATYGQGNSWTKPIQFDPVDWANFLSDLDWPTANKYVIVGNETNHSYEWQNMVDPASYAKYLIKTSQALKAKDPSFFILPGAMDVATPDNHISQSAYSYWRQMKQAEPTVFEHIDGWNSHSYPNPGFKGHPLETHRQSIVSYRHELEFAVNELGINPQIPVFITETGWSNHTLTKEQIADYFLTAYTSVWTDDNLITIAPFVLDAQTPPFNQFSIIDSDHGEGVLYNIIKSMSKTKAEPQLSPREAVLGESTTQPTPPNKTVYTPNITSSISKLAPFPKLTNWFSKLFSFVSLSPSTAKELPITISDQPVTLEVVSNLKDISRGLSYRPSLPDDRGMMFVMPISTRHLFWMKGMQFPLDFVWLNNEFTIVDLSIDIKPSQNRLSPIPTVMPKKSVKYVIEFNSGFIAKHGLKLGDSLSQIKTGLESK